MGLWECADLKRALRKREGGVFEEGRGWWGGGVISLSTLWDIIGNPRSNDIWRYFWFLHWKKLYFQPKASFLMFYLLVGKISKKQHNWFYKKFYKSGIVGRRKHSDPSLNRIFFINVLSISVQYTLSFQCNKFGLCLLSEKLSQINLFPRDSCK